MCGSREPNARGVPNNLVSPVFARLCLLALACGLTTLAIPSSTATSSSADSLIPKLEGPSQTVANYAQRALYLDAKRYLSQGKTSSYQRSLAKLGDYPLIPYLEYAALRRSISSLSDGQIADFERAYEHLPITPLLRQRWLRSLGAQAKWRRLLKHYDNDRNVEIRCYAGRAYLATGKKKAGYKLARELWLHGKSRPKACDPLFQRWIEAKQLSAQLVWDRLALALKANQKSLAKYLIRLLPKSQLVAGRYFYQAQVNPSSVVDANLPRKSTQSKQIVAHAHTRLVRQDKMAEADALRAKYRRWNFSQEQMQQMTQEALLGWSAQGIFFDDADDQSSQHEELNVQLTAFNKLTDKTQERLVLAAVRAQRWDLVTAWTERASATLQSKNQWQYWAARAAQENQRTDQPSVPKEVTRELLQSSATALAEQSDLPAVAADAQSLTEPAMPVEGASSPIPEAVALTPERNPVLAQLAAERDYYGFLAAQQLGEPAALNPQYSIKDAAQIAAVRTRPEVQRALELYAVREYIAARREWGALLPKLNKAEQAAAAHLAADIGWSRQAIEAANRAKLHNDTRLRFPVVHMSAYQRMSHATGVPLTLLLAVSRQESAFDERARSRADARGLMQLLPSTAQRIARQVHLTKPTNTALYRPSTNIEIASHYLAFLLDRFGGSRPLAIAGYNAGEHRVDRWLAEAADMPMDVWIERIPYHETRNYVKNVLAFSQVYNRKLDVEAPLLRLDELKVPLLPQSQTTSVAAPADATSPRTNRAAKG